MSNAAGNVRHATFGTHPLSKEDRSRPSSLGRGLDSLIPDAPASKAGQARAPIGSISPNPSQPRQAFDEAELEELAASIREHGILQPLLVREAAAGQYELIAGERRWRAAGLAELETVPIVVQDEVSDEDDERLTLALVENLQRSDLNPIELATALEQLSEAGWTQEGIAKVVGKSRTAVANSIRLRRLPRIAQSLIAGGSLSEGHGRALLGAPKSEQIALAQRAVERSWTVRKLEDVVRALSEPAAPRAARQAEADPLINEVVQRLESSLGTRVEVRVGAKGPSSGGRIVVYWYDEEQLDALTSRMGGVAEDEDEAGEFRI